MDFQLIATAVTTILAPFTPFLLEAGKNAKKKLAEKLGETSGEVTWQKAQELWKKITSRFGNDQKIKGAALMISAEPENENSQKILADILAIRLKEDPHLADELMGLLGGQSGVQRIVANRKSLIRNVAQQMTGRGEQSVEADNNSRIEGIRQIKK